MLGVEGEPRRDVTTNGKNWGKSRNKMPKNRIEDAKENRHV